MVTSVGRTMPCRKAGRGFDESPEGVSPLLGPSCSETCGEHRGRLTGVGGGTSLGWGFASGAAAGTRRPDQTMDRVKRRVKQLRARPAPRLITRNNGQSVSDRGQIPHKPSRSINDTYAGLKGTDKTWSGNTPQAAS